jgi:hypothetical protein
MIDPCETDSRHQIASNHLDFQQYGLMIMGGGISEFAGIGSMETTRIGDIRASYNSY